MQYTERSISTRAFLPRAMMTADSEPAISPRVDPQPVDAPPGDPFAPIVERPQLRIAHLMFWTACVAVYLSMIRMLQETDPDTSTVFGNVWMLYGLGAGTGLAGLLLGVAWRFRGMPFPVTGGEYMLVMTGIGTHFWLVLYAASWRATMIWFPEWLGLPS